MVIDKENHIYCFMKLTPRGKIFKQCFGLVFCVIYFAVWYGANKKHLLNAPKSVGTLQIL